MLIFGFVSAFIFVLLQFKSVRYQIFRLWDWRCRRDYQPVRRFLCCLLHSPLSQHVYYGRRSYRKQLLLFQLNTEVEEDCDVARERISVQQSSASGTNLLALEVQVR